MRNYGANFNSALGTADRLRNPFTFWVHIQIAFNCVNLLKLCIKRSKKSVQLIYYDFSFWNGVYFYVIVVSKLLISNQAQTYDWLFLFAIPILMIVKCSCHCDLTNEWRATTTIKKRPNGLIACNCSLVVSSYKEYLWIF